MPKPVEKIEQAYREAATDFSTVSGIPVKGVYTPEDIAELDFEHDIGLPGEYPFTRGHHPKMYRGKLWNIRQITGLSTPKRQNERLRFQIAQGANSVENELDGPTCYGIEPGQPYAEGQVGISGVSIHTLRDMEILTDGLPLDQLSWSAAATFPTIPQSYILAAQKHGYDPRDLRVVHGALYTHAPACIPSYSEFLYINGHYSTLGRWGNDFTEYVFKNLPKWNVWFSDGAVFAESGANAIQEIAFIIAERNELIREMQRRGLDIDTIGRRLSPVVALDRDFFEVIAKLRAARRIWARTMKEQFGATDPAAMCLRFHGNVVGSVCTRQQPLVNIARGTLVALAGILSGCLGLQIACYDEAWSTPTEESVRLAIRTQQVLRYESGVTRVADPLAGSYHVEWLTSRLEEEIEALVEKIENIGGWMAALQNGWVQAQLQKGFLDIQKKVQNGERTVIGVNRFVIPPEEDFKPKSYAPDTSDVEQYLTEYKEFKEKRNIRRVKEALDSLRRVAVDTKDSLVPYVFTALAAEATFPEIIGVLRMVDGLEYDWAGEREYPF